METGHDKVQGTDYAYTLHGWIKGVNSNILKADNDIGKDGYSFSSPSHVNTYIGHDVYSYALTYFNNSTEKDYKAINSVSGTSTDFVAAAPSVQTADLYNGNIRQMVSSYLDASAPSKTYGLKALLRNFTYDQLNRIGTADANDNLNVGTNSWGTTSSSSLYTENFAYDQNGNILNAQRNGNQSGSYAMDNLTYHYVSATNKLAYVTDAVSGDPYSSDIGNQSAGNYDYDAIGNLIKDNAEGISNIEWTVYGKIKKIVFTSGTRELLFKYDASGNRISKTSHDFATDNVFNTTHYVRDAQGNVMATYTEMWDTGNDLMSFKLAERHIYGSSRLGVDNTTLDLIGYTSTPVDVSSVNRTLNYRSYELTNHLGNVLAVVSDRKIAADSNSDGIIDYFSTDVLSCNDYYAFGATMPGRSFTSANYRYGFNGKETDSETNTQDYGLRIYNPALGKFLSVDPLTKEYPWNSTYAFAENDVIRCIDLEGAEKDIVTIYVDENGTQLGDPTFETLPRPGPLGDGTLTKYQQLKWYGGDVAKASYFDYAGSQYTPITPVSPTLFQNVEYEVKRFTKKVSDLLPKGSMKNYGVGEDWVKGAGFGVEGKAGVGKYSFALKAETYSRTENDAGLYFQLSFNVTGEVSDKIDLIKGTSKVSSSLIDFLPKLDLKGYGYVNLKASTPTTGMRNETYSNMSLSYGALRFEGDSKGVYKLGGGLGIDMEGVSKTIGVLQGKAGVVNKTTLFDGKTSTKNLQGSGN